MKRILCLGDSNTFGHDPRSRIGEPYDDSQRWTGLLAGQDMAVINAGRNGQCIYTPDEFSSLSGRFRSSMPLDAAVVMLGTNDLLRGAGAKEASARMERMLRFLLGSEGMPLLILIAPPPMELGEWVHTSELIDRSRQLAEEYRTLAQVLGIPFADAGEWNVELAFDGVHFTPAGHAAFAAGLKTVLAREIPRREGDDE